MGILIVCKGISFVSFKVIEMNMGGLCLKPFICLFFVFFYSKPDCLNAPVIKWTTAKKYIYNKNKGMSFEHRLNFAPATTYDTEKPSILWISVYELFCYKHYHLDLNIINEKFPFVKLLLFKIFVCWFYYKYIYNFHYVSHYKI